MVQDGSLYCIGYIPRWYYHHPSLPNLLTEALSVRPHTSRLILIDEIIKKKSTTEKTLDEIVDSPELVPFKGYAVEFLVPRYTNQQPVIYWQ